MSILRLKLDFAVGELIHLEHRGGPSILADTTSEMILTIICGCFVWGFGLILRIKIRKAIMEIDNR